MLTTIFIVTVATALVTWIVFHGVATRILHQETFLHAEPDASPMTSAPMVSVLIPAHDEERNIRRALEALIRQQYPRFEVIVADDRSTDGTARIVREVAEVDPRVRLIRVAEIPDEWVGKTWALQCASSHARGDVLLFLDADVQLDPGALHTMVAHFTRERLDMMSLFLRHDHQCSLDAAVHLIMAAIFTIRCLPDRVNRRDSEAVFANGQNIMMRTDVYREIGGHGPVRSLIQEDVGLAKLIKQHGRRFQVGYGFDVASAQWYRSLGEIWRGWTRIFYGVLEGNLFKFLWWAAVVALLVLVPCGALLGSGIMLLASGWSAAPFALMTLSAATLFVQESLMLRLHHMMRYDTTCLAMHVPAAMVVFAVTLTAAAKRVTTRDVIWRGNRYDVRHDLRKAS